MKTLIILSLALLAGCASAPSEYNQGCRDGVTTFLTEQRIGIGEKAIDNGCNTLDALHKQAQKEQQGGRRP